MDQEKPKTYWCSKCKENVECNYYLLNDGPMAECQSRCSKCKQCNFEAMCYNKYEIAKRSDARRRWWTASQKIQEFNDDLQAAIACGDFQKEKKARSEIGNWEKKRSGAEEEVGDAQHQHQR